ncbi:MAG: HlyC/CorC family transporter [Cellvibrionaceae bacterium]
MNDTPLGYLFGALFILLCLSSFFSSSETGMMSLNRYRLKHLANEGHRGAILANRLLNRTDRLIGVILIGNNLVNFAASALVTVIAIRLYGENGIVAATILFTLIVLVFSEVTPKTIAAIHPEKIAFPAAFILLPLLKFLYPVVWLVNHVSNFLVRLVGVNPNATKDDQLRPEELKTVVNEAGDLIPDQHQGMLLNVLDLGNATVEDIMIPRKEVIGIDMEDDIEEILALLQTTEFTRLPVYEGDLDNIVGILHLRNLAKILRGDLGLTKETIRGLIYDPYFIPESTALNVQLANFQEEKRRMGVVVNEYGEIQGIATLVDLLEEIVGDFATGTEQQDEDVVVIEDGLYEIDGTANIREINRTLDWTLPTDGAKTLNGLVIEHLEHIPDANMSFEIGDYRFETTAMDEKMVMKALGWRKKR